MPRILLCLSLFQLKWIRVRVRFGRPRRGGKNTKIHFLLNERMQLLNLILTGGQIHDSLLLLFRAKNSCRQGLLLSNDLSSSWRTRHRCLIPDKTNFKLKHVFDSEPKLSGVSFSGLRIIVILPLVTINCLFASLISSCLLLCYSLLIYQQPLKKSYGKPIWATSKAKRQKLKGRKSKKFLCLAIKTGTKLFGVLRRAKFFKALNLRRRMSASMPLKLHEYWKVIETEKLQAVIIGNITIV